MATTTLTLWTNRNLTPSMNRVIDNIDDYLGTGTSIANLQYMELTLDLEIKVDLGQFSNTQPASSVNYNYCKVVRSGTGFSNDGAYYFIVNKEWCNSKTVKLKLHMDVLNTYKWNQAYTVNAKTIVTREHKDRMKELTYKYVNATFPISSIAPHGSTSMVLSIPIIKQMNSPYIVNETPIIGIYNTFVVNGAAGIVTVTTHNNSSDSVPAGSIPLTFIIRSNSYEALIDLKSEGINAPLYKSEEDEIHDKYDMTWLLHYSNTNAIDPEKFEQVNPVECHLLNKTACSVVVPATNGEITISVISAGYTFYYIWQYLGEGFITVDNVDYPISKISNNNWVGLAITNNSGNLEVRRLSLSYDDYFSRVTTVYNLVTSAATSIVLKDAPVTVHVYRSASTSVLQDDNAEVLLGSSNYSYNAGTYSTYESVGAGRIDRTDSKNIKIIELPYSPTSFALQSNSIEFGGIWTWDGTNHWWYLNDDNAQFENEFVSTVDCPINDGILVFNSSTVGTKVSKDMYKETKLLHSDFYRPKFVYDSFGLDFMLELVDYDKYWENEYNEKLVMDFVMSRNIVSKFAFKIPQYTLKYSISDYDNVINVSRNNEQVLYTSQYINYLRTGYNYDLKSKERSELASGIGMGLSVASLIASIGLTASGYGSAVGVAGIVGSVAGIASTAVNYARTIAQNEQNIQEKLQASKNQSVNVQNADDVDLLNAYSNNRAKICLYEVSSVMKEALFDLFYYCGYNTYEQKIPSVDSRMWFNFLQCDLEINGTTYNISEDKIKELKDKFKEGVTFFHKVNGEWDLNQQYENWEVSLYE